MAKRKDFIKFDWVGPKVDSNNSSLKDENDFYRSCIVNNEVYSVNEFVIINVSKNTRKSENRVCQILCMFESQLQWHDKARYRGTVRWYTWARDLEPKNNPRKLTFNKNNEVIEDFRGIDNFISLEDIKGKCCVIFATENDPLYLNYAEKLNEFYFLCRYKLNDMVITPRFPDFNIDNTDILDGFNTQCSTPTRKNATPIKLLSSKRHVQKRKSVNEDLLAVSIDADFCETKTKINSPVNPRKNIKLTPKHKYEEKLSSTFLTPNRVSSVKRNLNESFDSIPSSQDNTPILNYSVVEQIIDSDKQIKMKLKLSDRQNPEVRLTQIKDDIVKLLLSRSDCTDETDFCVLSTKDICNVRKSVQQFNFDKEPKVIVSNIKDDKISITVHEQEPESDSESSEFDMVKASYTTPSKSKCISSKSIRYCKDDVIDKVPDERIFDNKKNQINDRNKNEENSNTRKVRQSQRSSMYAEPSKETPTRKSNRLTQRISYAEYTSPLNTPNKRNRKKSTDSESSAVSVKTPRKCSTKIPSNNFTYKTPSTKSISPKNDLPSSRPKRNTGELQFIKDVQNCLESNESQPNTPKKHAIEPEYEINQTSPTKRQVKTPKRYICEELTSTKKVEKSKTPAKKLTHDDPKVNSSIKKINHRRKSARNVQKYSEYEENSDIETEMQIPKRQINTPKRYMTNQEHNTPLINRTNKAESSVRSSAVKLISELSDSENDENIVVPKTPKQKSVVSTPKSILKNTPSARAKLIRDGVITPSVQARVTPIKCDKTPLNKARTHLHVSYVPKALPCREQEFSEIFNFLEGKLLDGCGGCMYISGVPGTGKTATVTDVIKKLEGLVKSGDVPKFEYVNINGMKLSEPRQSYVEILRQLTGKTVAWEQAQTMLDTKFTKTGKKTHPIVLLVDELDILCTKRQDVVYNLLDWPTKASAQLIVITIANTMDLPERLLMGRVTSRLGLTRLTFQAYTHKQLQEIVTKRLMGINAFNPDAIQLVARKVASVSGDARRALDICRRAAEIAESEKKNILVSMTHVNEALNAMITQPKVRAIKHCSRLQQLILQAILAEVERTGVEETTFADVYTMLVSVAAIDGFTMVSCTLALRAVSCLSACRLLLSDQKSNDINQKLILNVSPDDVYYALRKD